MNAPLYWCLLDEQPHYLVPPASKSAQVLEGLVVNPNCRFSWQTEATMPAVAGDDAAGFLPADCIAWVRDDATRATWPYWIGNEFIDAVVALSSARIRVAQLPPRARWVLAQAGILVQPEIQKRRQQEARRRVVWARQHFKRGFVPMLALVPAFHLGAMRRYYRQCVRAGGMTLGDSQVTHRHIAHNEPVARYVQKQLTAAVSAIAERPVKPSYAYVAAYRWGAQLERHTDRPQCEYTISLCVDYVPDASGPCPWPMKLELAAGTLSVFQHSGDGLLFRGRQIPHRRGRLAGWSSVTNILMHYVDQGFTGPLE